MRLLLDECVPRRLKQDFTGHQVFTVDEANLKGLKNGKLLQAASVNFDVLVTVDKSIPSQQSIALLEIAVLIFRAKNNRHHTLKELVPKALMVLDQMVPGNIVIIE